MIISKSPKAREELNANNNYNDNDDEGGSLFIPSKLHYLKYFI